VLSGPIISRLFTCSNAEKLNKKTKGACTSPISMVSIHSLKTTPCMYDLDIYESHLFLLNSVVYLLCSPRTSGTTRSREMGRIRWLWNSWSKAAAALKSNAKNPIKRGRCRSGRNFHLVKSGNTKGGRITVPLTSC